MGRPTGELDRPQRRGTGRARLRGALTLAAVFLNAAPGLALNQPTAILHAHDEPYRQVKGYVCALAKQGYSHVQIAPAQRSNGDPAGGAAVSANPWWSRYQPVDFLVIQGRGSLADLQALTHQAHSCGMKVIADVVFNHMASDPQFAPTLTYPTFQREHFHPPCPIHYNDGKTNTERQCWLNGDLPDLNQTHGQVMGILRQHLKLLLKAGVDGFRFDAAKHIDPKVLNDLIATINRSSKNRAWNYLEVIDDNDTKASMYTPTAAVTDFLLCESLQRAFRFGGSLSSLRVPTAINDSRSVTFGVNHDSDPSINPGFPKCSYANRDDAVLADAYVLARESGTPLILAKDNLTVAYLPTGAMFRRLMMERGKRGLNVREQVLDVADTQSMLVMERGSEGLFVVNKSSSSFDTPVLDLTLSNLEGCYQELRNKFTVAIERNGDGRKFISRWGTRQRGGLQVAARDALYFVRVAMAECR
jgi:alpha-amylase